MKMRNREGEMADQLDTYIDRPVDGEEGGPEPVEAPIIEALRLTVDTVKPAPEFVERLSARLGQEGTRSPSWLRRWEPSWVWIKQTFGGGLTVQKGFALAATAVAIILAIVLPMILDGDQAPPPLPRLVHAAGPSLEPAPPGLLTGAELTLGAELPDAPSEAPVYVAQSLVPSTPEEALAWAQEFGLTDARLYRDPREPKAIFVRASDDRYLTFRRFGPMVEIHYGDDGAAAREGAPLPFEQAGEAAAAFLRAHNLLPDEYRVQEMEDFEPGAENPFRMVEIVPLLDVRLVVGDRATMHISVNPAGEVTYAALNPLTFERSHAYPIKSAQEAYEVLTDGNEGSPFRLDVDRSAPDAPDVRHYQPQPPAYSVGDVVTATGWVRVLVAEDGSDIYAHLTARDGLEYDLTGPHLAELTDVDYDDVRVTGSIAAQTGAQRWQLAMSDWETAPPQKIQCLVGTFVREDGQTWLEVDEAAVLPEVVALPESGRYRLPGAPDDLGDGERIEVCAGAWPAGDDDVDWWGITTPPLSEQTPVAVSSSSTSVVVEAVEEAPAAPLPPTPTPLPPTHVVQEGETLRMIADRYGVTVDALLEANDDVDASQISVGQLLFIPESLQPVTEPQPASAATSTPVPPSPPRTELPFEIGQQVEITGVVYATIYVDGDTWRTVAHLSTPALPVCPLLGPQELLEELAQHHQLHVRVWGEVVAAGEEGRPMEQAIQMERFEKLWPEERLLGFLGHVELETLEGRQVAVFTDHETDQRYVIGQSLEAESYWAPGRDSILDFEQIFVTGIVHPEATYVGLPVLRLVSSKYGWDTRAATSADQFTVDVGPNVVNEAERRAAMGELQGAFVVDRVELSYYYEPQPGYVIRSEYGPPPTPEPPEETVVQPVWVFHGHNADGSVRFTAYVQAVVETHLVTLEPTASEPTIATPTVDHSQSGQIRREASPDGQWIAIIDEVAGSLALEGPQGDTSIIFPEGSTVGAVEWSPDSRRLLVVRSNLHSEESTGYLRGTDPIALWAVTISDDQDIASERVFQSATSADEEGSFVPEQIQFGDWSPNGRYLLFWYGMLGASAMADGLRPVILDVERGRTISIGESALLNEHYHSWASDSSALAITVGGGRSAQVNKWLNIVDLDSGEVTTVISDAEQVPGMVAWSPAEDSAAEDSAKGDAIAYAAVPAEETGEEHASWMVFENPAIAARRVYLLDPATGEYRRLNGVDAYQDAPVWSSDGKQLYYVQREPETETLVLMVADLGTGEAQPIEASRRSAPPNMRVGYYGQAKWDEVLSYVPVHPTLEPDAGDETSESP